MADACLTAQSLETLLGDDGNHKNGGQRVGPPPAKQGIECEPFQQDRGEINADRTLPRCAAAPPRAASRASEGA